MKVLVIGAGGKTGRLVVERALAAGHQVIALLHHAPQDEKHALPLGVRVHEGDVANPLTLKTAMEGCEAVIDTIGGTTPFLETTLEADAARSILEVMPAVGARRLIVISMLGVAESESQAGFFYDHIFLPTFLRGASKDKAAMEEEVRHSDIDWTIVRPPILSDSDPTGSVHIVTALEKAHKITRADLAQWIVDQLTSADCIHQAVTIANS